ncbi:hypothetical protein VB834_09750 [Limnoraphis robusta Tam1]|uniref:Uncharacterized protein n=1 Tax=Limnoraphis robusta CCNP1315 TaxID=3110306 RepID=A0ABU5TSZ3_9CYAN|nr:hypothetical protein [Limnoraphis robusta]MEA5499337.1 hypothetical protein [Limnoraphis robusta BA-68 BA1]MEA5518011.1 hypothetical protein [Limnoraphis robusta CCNP1315]MEA5539316.1 hypothetical protein [Limnoraphis robusta Tam1]MEA5547260.1 hypothetical protein [Limnoraphis robusta CCNP1324]
MRLPIEKVSNPIITSSNFKEDNYNIPPLWIQQAGLEWFYQMVRNLL